MKKAPFIYNEKSTENDCEGGAPFVASTALLQKFMHRNGLCLKLVSTIIKFLFLTK